MLDDLVENRIQGKALARGIVRGAQLTEDLPFAAHDGVQAHRSAEQVADCGFTGLRDHRNVTVVRAQDAVAHPGQLIDLWWDRDVALDPMTGGEDEHVGADARSSVSGEPLPGVDMDVALVEPKDAKS